MYEQQRKFFNDPRRHVLSLGVRHGRTQHGQEIKQAIEKQAERRNEITEIAIDECKEMSPQDFEKIKDHSLLGKVEGDIQTSKNNDWLKEFAKESEEKNADASENEG